MHKMYDIQYRLQYKIHKYLTLHYMITCANERWQQQKKNQQKEKNHYKTSYYNVDII